MIGKHNTGGFKVPVPQAFPYLKGELNVPMFKKHDQVEVIGTEHEHRGRFAEVFSADTTEENPGHEVGYLIQFFGTTQTAWVDEHDLRLVPDGERLPKREPVFKNNPGKFDPEALRKAGANLAQAMNQAFQPEDRPAELKKDRITDPMLHARKLVWGIFYNGNIFIDDVYVVWFCAALQNWKALVSTNVKDNCYYEVTHNGAKNETYVDKYVRHQNVCVEENLNRYI